MKISSYTLFAILPFTIQSVIATPVAEPDFDTLEERGGGNHKDWDKDWDNNWWNGHHDKNVCEVKQTYPYYKYPCSSSPSNGTSLLGATFTSFCKYQCVFLCLHEQMSNYLSVSQKRRFWSLVCCPQGMGQRRRQASQMS